MGGSQSVEIPGGGSEGYHVLKVASNINLIHFYVYILREISNVLLPCTGAGELPGREGGNGTLL